jgi:hypothetical protein
MLNSGIYAHFWSIAFERRAVPGKPLAHFPQGDEVRGRYRKMIAW